MKVFFLLASFSFFYLNSLSQHFSSCFKGEYVSGANTIDFNARLDEVESKRYTHVIRFEYAVRQNTNEQVNELVVQEFYCKQVDIVFYFAKDSTYFNQRKSQCRLDQNSNLLITDVSFMLHNPNSTTVLMRDVTWLLNCGDNGFIDVEIMESEEPSETFKYIDAYDFCEEDPTFPGGTDSLNAFIKANMIYPALCTEMGIQGIVWVQFIVELDGSLSQPVIVKGIDPILDKEALRIVRLMPAWIPGKQAGKVVGVKYVQPIKFKIEE